LKRLFHIVSDKAATDKDLVLLCEVSQHHISLALADGLSKQLHQASYYELRNVLEPDKLQDVLKAENVDISGIKRVVLGSALNEVVLVPLHHFDEESARQFFTAVHGNTPDPLVFDEIRELNLVLVHAVPAGIMGFLKSLRLSEAVHAFSCQLRSYNGFVAEDQITVHFTGKEIRVIAKREQQLKLAQSYFYTAPMDVVYYLLSIAREYGFSQTDTALILSGLISEDSAMYKELHQYFSAVHFWKPVTKTTLQSEHPQHFFSSIYNLAGCVL
jgi:hypothetical protein